MNLGDISLGLTVNDIDKSLAWYRDVLGCTAKERWEQDGKLLGVEMYAGKALFMLGYGIQLCRVTQYSTMAEFPHVSQAAVYLPIPIAGLLTLLFLIERIWVGDPPPTSIMYSDQATELE